MRESVCIIFFSKGVGTEILCRLCIHNDISYYWGGGGGGGGGGRCQWSGKLKEGQGGQLSPPPPSLHQRYYSRCEIAIFLKRWLLQC